MSRIPKAVSEYLAAIGSKGERKGGKATSQVKVSAARRNGTKGGRPCNGQRSPEPAGPLGCHKTKNRAHSVTECAQGVA